MKNLLYLKLGLLLAPTLALASEPVSPTHEVLINLTGQDTPHMQGVAEAIDLAAPTPERRALLLAKGKHESRFDVDVCRGETTGDSGKAFGCWQSWEKDRSGGIEGQARRADRHLWRCGNYCAARGFDRVEGAISLYATGTTCEWSGAPARVATYRRVLAQLYASQSH